MGKNKLRKFAEMELMPNVLEYPFARLREEAFPYRGKWHSKVFGNDLPIVLELGCGRGEYTVGMATQDVTKNFIGIDIKGNRMWNGAKIALERDMGNVRFLRTQIEFLHHFFADGEVSEIWLTFPDPQMKKVRKRLTSTRFLQAYKRLLSRDGILHLKTDSLFLYTFTRDLLHVNGVLPIQEYLDLHSDADAASPLRTITTYYESQWLARGLDIKYIAFKVHDLSDSAVDPEEPETMDSYRSFGREKRNELRL